MGRTKGSYRAEFEVGEQVCIANREFLLRFIAEWKYHHPLQPEQVAYADKIATVRSVGFYHGGDELYTLFDVPGIWNEECLRPLREEPTKSEGVVNHSRAFRSLDSGISPHIKEFLNYGFFVKTPGKNRVVYSEGWRRVTIKSDPAGSHGIAIFTDTIRYWELPFGLLPFWPVSRSQREKIISRISLCFEAYGLQIEPDHRRFP